MSLLNLVQGQRVYTQQIQHDLSTSNVMINCDPRLKGPKGSVLDVKSKAGKVGVEDDICDLTVANLSANRIITEDIFLNGASLANEIFQGFLTTPLQVDIDANNKNITNAAQITSGIVETSSLKAPSTSSLAINGTGININGGGGTSGDLILNVSETANDAIELLFNQASGSTGGIPTTNTIQIGANAVNGFTGTQPKNQKVVIGTAPNGIDDGTQGPVNTIITIGSVGTASLPANKEQNRLVFFAGSGVTSTTGGTNPDELAGNGLDKATIDAATGAAAGNAAAIADITQILQDYGLIQ
tara:strand:- start:41 stop:940 length:900 start_codon:yes stop_codon:yes gene_type:complete